MAYKRRKRFAGNRDAALERDGHKCRLCGKTDGLIMHHLDGTGESSPYENNHALDNLVTLCRGCHQRAHRMDYQIVNGVIIVNNPLAKFVGFLPMVFRDQVVTPTMQEVENPAGIR